MKKELLKQCLYSIGGFILFYIILGLLISSLASANENDTFRINAKKCYLKLTNGKYVGEEKSLDIIDYCVNLKEKKK